MISQLDYPSLYHSPNKSQPQTQSDQSDAFHIISQLPLKHLPSNSKSKLKSSLCKNFTLNGFCPYGARCQFAHGPEQLRCNAIANTSYKTKPCFSFLKTGYCPYGHRCNFKHREENPSQKLVRSAIVQNFPQMLIGMGGDKSKLLSRFAVK